MSPFFVSAAASRRLLYWPPRDAQSGRVDDVSVLRLSYLVIVECGRVHILLARAFRGEPCGRPKKISHKAVPRMYAGFKRGSLRRLFRVFEVVCCLRQFMSIVTGAGSLFRSCAPAEFSRCRLCCEERLLEGKLIGPARRVCRSCT